MLYACFVEEFAKALCIYFFQFQENLRANLEINSFENQEM
jgi:RsiW-degrading membrane proteinase PrsW (M82 family)